MQLLSVLINDSGCTEGFQLALDDPPVARRQGGRPIIAMVLQCTEDAGERPAASHRRPFAGAVKIIGSRRAPTGLRRVDTVLSGQYTEQ